MLHATSNLLKKVLILSGTLTIDGSDVRRSPVDMVKHREKCEPLVKQLHTVFLLEPRSNGHDMVTFTMYYMNPEGHADWKLLINTYTTLLYKVIYT